MDDGWKTPKWDDTPIVVPRRVLQEVELALSDVRGLIQRLNSHTDLDARDRRALTWGREVLASVRWYLYYSK